MTFVSDVYQSKSSFSTSIERIHLPEVGTLRSVEVLKELFD